MDIYRLWERVLYHFDKITKIPRGSGNEEGISNYLKSFAEANGLKVYQDSSYNILIKKNGSYGLEDASPVILQGHMDMICVKEEGVEVDFAKDPIKYEIKDDFIYGIGTSLGADNGIGMAYMMAILESDQLKHPPLEILITTGEEAGMTGAANMEFDNIYGKRLINLDMEEEGKILVCCAGGLTNNVLLDLKQIPYKKELISLKINITGLKGGHSGVDIDKGRANAIKLMGRLLNTLKDNYDINLVSIKGGSFMNAIPSNAEAVIAFDAVKLGEVKDEINRLKEKFINEYSVTDSNLNVSVYPYEDEIKNMISNDDFQKIISLIMLIPNGIQTMSPHIDGLVESSTNVGVMKIFEGKFNVTSCVRSSVESLKYEITDRIKKLSDLLGAQMTNTDDYPEWQYQEVSPLRETCIETYQKMYGEKPKVFAVHAGVECGLFKKNLGNLDMISIGPNLYDVHTPKEKLDLKSANRTFEYLIEILANLN